MLRSVAALIKKDAYYYYYYYYYYYPSQYFNRAISDRPTYTYSTLPAQRSSIARPINSTTQPDMYVPSQPFVSASAPPTGPILIYARLGPLLIE